MRERVEFVRALLEQADAQTAALRARTALACPPRCGACCLSPEVETSVAELLPMALELVRSGRAAALLETLAPDAPSPPERCALYAPDPDEPRRGRCQAYAERPLVCRLFGFTARRDRLGRPRLAACATMRAALPGDVAAAERALEAGLPAGVGGDLSQLLALELPGEGSEQLPINVALRRALERVLLAERYAALERLAPVPAAEAADGPPGPPLDRRPAA